MLDECYWLETQGCQKWFVGETHTSKSGTASYRRARFNRWSSSQLDGEQCEQRGSQRKLFLGRWRENLLCSVGWSGCEDKLQEKSKREVVFFPAVLLRVNAFEGHWKCCNKYYYHWWTDACFRIKNTFYTTCKRRISHRNNKECICYKM